MSSLVELGIDLQDVTDRLLADGVRLFATAFEKLLDAVEEQSREAQTKRINSLTYTLPASMGAAVASSLADWDAAGNVRRLWQRDPTLWSGRDEAQWLGWLGITDDQLAHAQRFRQMADAVRDGGFTHVLLLGMGGSSLGPEVIRRTFGKHPGFSGATHPGLDGPGAGQGRGGRRRHPADAVHRIQQVRLDAGAQHLQAVLLRARR